MLEKLTGIVLGTLHHNEKTDIINILTKERGLIPFVANSSATPAGRRRRSQLMPLSAISMEIDFKPNRNMHRLGGFSITEVWTSIHSEPQKQAIAIFLTEFLTKLMREAPADANMWDFLFHSLRFLDRSETGIGDFHLIFLSKLLHFTGISPDTHFSDGTIAFDMREGIYVDTIPLHRDILTGNELHWPRIMMRIDFRHGGRLRLNRRTRNLLLDGILKYYAIHFPGLGQLKSPEILATLFD